MLRAGGCTRVHVVLGAAADAVRERAELPGCVLVDNPEWEEGMGSSLRAGLDSLAGTGARAALVSLVDQPGIGPEAVARVLAAYRSAESLAAAAYDGERGHPVLFGAAPLGGDRRDRDRGPGGARLPEGARGRDHARRVRGRGASRTTSTRRTTWSTLSEAGVALSATFASTRRISTSTNH